MVQDSGSGQAIASTDWQTWADGVLSGIGAPKTSQNYAILNAWSRFESGANLMRWNNPLNTTEPWAGSVSQNGVGVKSYQSVQDGIDATVATLKNGYYPNIVSDLQSSADPSTWLANASHDLGTWGTGVNFLHSVGGISGNQASSTPSTSNVTLSASKPSNPLDVPGAIGNAVSTVVGDFKNALMRAGLFLVGFMLIGVALLILFSRQVSEVTSTVDKTAGAMVAAA